jgi:3(or 17)beta-hydroxysteroid dehydrogenase
MGRVSGKVALITGGASGLGAAGAETLAREGATVIITDIDAALGQKVAASHENIFFAEHDVRDEAAWQAVVAGIERDHGRLDILYNNAGVVKFASIEDCTLEDFRFVNAVMVEGTFLGCKTAIPLMARSGGGSIVNMGSIAGIKGISVIPGYSAAKGAIQALTRNVAAHCREAHNNIRCNAIVAGSIRTPMTLRALQEMSPDSGSFEELEGHGQGQPEDVANLLLYLASDESRHMNGASLTIDNGETA